MGSSFGKVADLADSTDSLILFGAPSQFRLQVNRQKNAMISTHPFLCNGVLENPEEHLVLRNFIHEARYPFRIAVLCKLISLEALKDGSGRSDRYQFGVRGNPLPRAF